MTSFEKRKKPKILKYYILLFVLSIFGLFINNSIVNEGLRLLLISLFSIIVIFLLFYIYKNRKEI